MIDMERCDYCDLVLPREQVCHREADLEDCINSPEGPDDED